jgi:hypothetical protein
MRGVVSALLSPSNRLHVRPPPNKNGFTQEESHMDRDSKTTSSQSQWSPRHLDPQPCDIFLIASCRTIYGPNSVEFLSSESVIRDRLDLVPRYTECNAPELMRWRRRMMNECHFLYWLCILTHRHLFTLRSPQRHTGESTQGLDILIPSTERL